MSKPTKKHSATAFNAGLEWDMLQPKRDEVSSEINSSPRKAPNFALERNSSTAIKRAKSEFKKQDKSSKKFLEERMENVSLVVEAQNKWPGLKASSFKY